MCSINAANSRCNAASPVWCISTRTAMPQRYAPTRLQRKANGRIA
jgi:hypothetical protein